MEVTSQGLSSQPGHRELGSWEPSTGVGWQTILKGNYRDFRVEDSNKIVLPMFWTFRCVFYENSY